MGVLQLLASDNFITCSKVVAKQYGLNAAVLLGAMCSYQNAFGNQEFYKEQTKICEDTCLSVYEIQQAIKVLKENGLITVNKRGCPAKNYYYVVEVKLSKILTTCDEKIKQQDAENLDHINNNIITKKETKNKIIKEESLTIDDIILKQKEAIQEPLREFVKMRKAIKKPITTRGLQLAILQLNKFAKTVDEQINIINQSIMNSWQGLYELKEEPRQNKAKPIEEMDENERAHWEWLNRCDS